MAVAELYGGLSAFKTMFDMAKSLKDINDTAIRNGAVIELQSQILSAQEAQTALVTRVRELEEKVAGFEKWNTEKERYELQDIGNGILAYTVKPSMDTSGPSHSICPDCYEHRIKSILQPLIRTPGMSHLKVCQTCGWEAYVVGYWLPEHGGKSTSRRTR